MSEQKDPDRDYPVGYGRPPKASQFKPGQSGNPKGRPKGIKNISTYIDRELKSKVIVTENGVRKRISKAEAIAKQVVNKGIAGDLKTLPILNAGGHVRLDAQLSDPSSAALASREDESVIRNIILRIRQSQSSNENSDTVRTADQEPSSETLTIEPSGD